MISNIEMAPESDKNFPQKINIFCIVKCVFYLNQFNNQMFSEHKQIFIAFETEMPPELEQKNSKPERD